MNNSRIMQGGGHRQTLPSCPEDIASLSLQTVAFLWSDSPLIQYRRQKGSTAHTMSKIQPAFIQQIYTSLQGLD